MKHAALVMVLAVVAAAQAATRPVILTWTPGTGQTGTLIYSCVAVSPAVTCTPNTSGTPLATLGAAATTYTDPAETVGTYVGYTVLGTAAACTSSTPVGTACGAGTPVTGVTPIPPRPGVGTNVVITVP
jgi:hypothetical protein